MNFWRADAEIQASERVVQTILRWLIETSRRHALFACLVFILISTIFLVAGCIYDAATGPFKFVKGISVYFSAAVSQSRHGGLTALLICSTTPFLVYLYFSRRIKDYALLSYYNDSFVSGDLGRTTDGVQISMIIGTALPALLYVISSHYLGMV